MLWFIVFAIGSAWWFNQSNAQFLTLGAAASFIVTIPTIQSRYRLYSAWTIVVLVTYIGCGIRNAFISFGIDDQEGSLENLFLMGQTPDFFLRPSLIYVASIGLLTLAYMVGSRSSKHRHLKPMPVIRNFDFRDNAVGLSCLLAFVGFVAFVVYVQQTGGFHISDLSRKRSTIASSDGSNYSGYGVLRAINSFSAVALWLVVARFATKRRVGGPISRAVLIGVLAVNAIALPFYASSRTTSLLILIIAWTISQVLSPKRVSYRKLAVAGLALFMLLGLMTLLREIAQRAVATRVQLSSVFYTALSGIVYNQNFGDMEVTSHVLNAVPDVIPFQYGQTILTWFVAPIPRSLWPSKPVVNVGPLIGTTLYGTTGSGVPPGFVADFYLNFGLAGSLVGALVLGLVLGRIGRFRTYANGLNPGAVVLYYSFALVFANSAIEDGIGSGIFNGLESAVPAAVGLLLVGVRARNAEKNTVVARRLTRTRSRELSSVASSGKTAFRREGDSRGARSASVARLPEDGAEAGEGVRP